MQSNEAVYFTALHDSNGRRLSCSETYRIQGADFPARWWSVTAYRNYQLIPNVEQRYSFSKTNIIREEDDFWCLTLSPQPQPGNWIPLGETPGQLVISLRLYNPAVDAIEEIANHPLPEIVLVADGQTPADQVAAEHSQRVHL